MKKKQPGFALVLALVLMGFIVMLLLSLSTTLMVETNVSTATRLETEAKSNAQFALVKALGELQELAGPDQRITARADILTDDAPYWTGVWSSDPDDINFTDEGNDQSQSGIKNRGAMKWLVSLENNGSEASLAPYANRSTSTATDDEVVLAQDDTDGVAIILPKEDILLDGVVTGRYAYWVADEGLKASVSLMPTSDGRDYNLDSRAPASMNALAIDGIADAADGLEDADLLIGSTTSLAELPIALGASDQLVQDYTHDITSLSRSVPVNVRDAGLKRDLTAAFENTDDFQDLLTFHGANQVFAAQSASANDRDPGGPRWEQLRSHYTLRLNDDGELQSREGTDTQTGVYPVIAQFSLHHHLILHGAGQYQPRLCIFPVVVLWNPYDQPIAVDRYYVKVTDNNQYNGEEALTMEVKGRVFLEEDDGRPDTKSFTSNNGITIYYKESDTFPNTNDPLRFELDSPVIQPGEALVFSPESITKMDSNPETPMPLAVGFYEGEYFYYEDVGTINLDQLGVAQNVTDLSLNMMSANYLRVRLARDSVNNVEDDVLLQHVSGQNYFVTGSGASGRADVKWPASNDALISSTEANQPIIAGHSNYDSATFPAAGAYMHLKLPENYAEVNNNDDLTSAQRDVMPYIRAIANYNPRAPRSTKTPLEQVDYGNNNGSDFAFNPNYFGNTENYHWDRGLPVNNSYRAYNHGDERINFSFTDDPTMIADGGFVLFEAPTDDGYFLSIADLAHANLSQPFINPSKYYNNPLKTYSTQNSWPAYAIGNSLQDPRIPANLTARSEWPDSNPDPNGYYHYDVSYLLNDALWDAYFFSAYDTTENQSTNPRHALSNFNFGFDTSAAGIYIEGAFNVNSTSVRAWKAFLASAQAAAVESRSGQFSDSDTTAFLRVAQPNGEPASDLRNTYEDAVYNGFLTLSSTDIDRLAEAIVEQVKKRGPFISMSHFVNRVLDDANYRSERESDYQSSDADGARAMMVGALQAAIDLSEINLRNGAGEDRFNDAEVQLIQTDLEAFYRELDIEASIGDRAAGAPGYLTQLDLLDAIGPYISTRSDTFVIHAYGESINPLTDEVQATARCKATVQRLPEFVEDRANSATDNYADLSTQNKTFGRKFRIIDFQWID